MSSEVAIGATAATPSRSASSCGHLDLGGEQVVVADRIGCRRRDEQRAVRARAELLLDDVERLVAGRSGRLAPAIGEPEPHRHGRDGDDQQRHDGAEHGEDRAEVRHRRDLLRRLRGRELRADRGALAARQQPQADETQEGRGERDRDEHGDGDADRADGAHQPEERDAGDVEGEQRHDHRRPGEDDGRAGRARREPDRLLAPAPRGGSACGGGRR